MTKAEASFAVEIIAEQLRRSVPGGIGTYTKGLLQGLSALEVPGLHIELVASATRARPDPLAALGWPVAPLLLPNKLLSSAWDLGLVPVGHDADVVHAPSLAVPPSRVPVVATVHDLSWRSLPGGFPRRGRRWHEKALRRLARRAKAIVVPSEPVADALEQADVGIDRSRIEVIAEGADHLPPPDESATEELLCRRGIEGPYLLVVGTLEPRKNLARAISAYASIRDRLPRPWPLLLVGPTGWRGSGGGPAPDVHALDGVTALGAVEPAVLAGLYARSRALVYVPLLEGFGLPVVEAMLAGTPVCSSPVPASGNATELVDPLDVASIARGMLAVAADDGRRNELVAAGRAHVAPLSWRQTAEAHVALWRRVADGASR